MANSCDVRKSPPLTRLEKTELFVYYRYADPPEHLRSPLLKKVLADEIMRLDAQPKEKLLENASIRMHGEAFGKVEKAYCEAVLETKKDIFESAFRPIMNSGRLVLPKGRLDAQKHEFLFFELRNETKVQDLLSKKDCMRALVFNSLIMEGKESLEVPGPILREYLEVQTGHYHISRPREEEASMQNAFEKSVNDFIADALDWWITTALAKDFASFSSVFSIMGGHFSRTHRHLEEEFLKNAARRFLEGADSMLDRLVIRIVDEMKAAASTQAPGE